MPNEKPPGITLVAGPFTGQRRSLPGPVAAGALVVVDVQRSFADPSCYHPPSPDVDRAVAGAVAQAGTLVTVARRSGLRVVWVRLEQTPDEPWLASHWLRAGPDGGADEGAGAGAGAGAGEGAGEEPCLAGTFGAEWFSLAPEPGETIVTKRFYSGFLGTGLAGSLHAAGVTWLVVCGLTTECCVAATAQDGIQHGFRVLISSDASAAYDLDWHQAALAMLAANVGHVTTTADLVTALGCQAK